MRTFIDNTAVCILMSETDNCRHVNSSCSGNSKKLLYLSVIDNIILIIQHVIIISLSLSLAYHIVN